MTISTALVLVAAILGGVSTLLAGASLILHALAPHTKTKLDDKAAADIDKLKADVDKLTKLLPINPSNAKQSGKASLTPLIIMALIGLVAACSLSMSCTAAQKKAVSDFGHCEETAAVKDLEGPIKSIGDQFIAGKLSKDSAMALLDSFAASYGLDTVGCAVTLVGQLFSSKVSGSADTSAATDLYNEWLAKHRQASAAPRSTLAVTANIDPSDPVQQAGLNLATSGVITGSPAVAECAVDNMPGSPPSSDIPCNATITTLGSTFYGFEPQETEVTADGHVYIWHFGSDGVATYTEAAPTVKP